ncbi:MAG: hypothetical protein N2484_07610 [Clostridia bacterium]|nr:hypothetical protein [Clostridia bacterium]
MIDAVSSPDKKLIIIQTSKAMKAYRVIQGRLGDIEMEIPMDGNERIVLNQWATGKYVMKWGEELSKILK